MRYIAIICVFIGCVLGGFWRDLDQKKRIKELESFGYVFEILKAEIDYRLTPLKDACSMAASRIDDECIIGIMNHFQDSIQEKKYINISDMWTNSINCNKSQLHLKEEDIKVLYQFGAICGCIDKNMEKRNIEMCISALNEVIFKAKEDYIKESKLNKSLGVLIGLAISIFLI